MALPSWTLLGSAAALAAVPLLWVLLHRGARRRREQEGSTDGFLLLFALLCALGTLWLGGVSLVRQQREARELAESDAVPVELQRCRITRQRPAGRTGGWSHELSCDVVHRARDASAHEHVLVAGYPPSRAPLERWRDRHPPGTVIELRQATGDPERLTGFAEQVPAATTTARGAARQSLLLAVVGFLLFVASRLVVARRLAAR
jgi:hypothetical protein